MISYSITGTAWCYGDNINTDLIYPGKYLITTTPNEMAKYALAGLDPKFSSKAKSGDVIIAGSNFGSGSSREQAAISLKYTGISAVIAVSFARIFYRNAINQGIPVLLSSDAISIVNSGDKIELKLVNGELNNLTNGKTCKFEPLPAFILKIIEAGGIIPHLRKKLNIK